MDFISSLVVAIGEIRKMMASSPVDRAANALAPSSRGEEFLERPVDSLARKARQSILFFPLVASESIGPAAASILARAVQVRCTSYVQLMVSNLDILPDTTGGRDGPKAALVGAIGGMDLPSHIRSEDCTAVGAIVARRAAALAEEALRPGGLRPPLERHLLAEARGPRTSARVDVDASLDDAEAEEATSEVRDQKQKVIYDKSEPSRAAKKATPDEVGRLAQGGPAERLAATRIIAQWMADARGEDLARLGGAAADLRALVSRLPPEGYELWANRVAPAKQVDLEKTNRFPPTLLELEVQVLYGDPGRTPVPVTTKLVVGVRSPLHQVPSLDLVTGLGTSLQRDSLTLQFFRMATGEIDFVRDFILNLGHVRARATGQLTAGSRKLEALRRQAEWNEARRSWLVKAVAQRGFTPPTATVAVTADEVALIRSLYRVDFSSPSVASQFMRSHNLMGFMIVDEAVGLVRVYEDGDGDFDRVPLSELDKQGKETSVKDILKIIGTR